MRIASHSLLAHIRLIESLPSRFVLVVIDWLRVGRSHPSFHLLLCRKSGLLSRRRLRSWYSLCLRLRRLLRLCRRWKRFGTILPSWRIHVLPRFELVCCVLCRVMSCGGCRLWEVRESICTIWLRSLPRSRLRAPRRGWIGCVYTIWISRTRLPWVERLTEWVYAHPLSIVVILLLGRRLAQYLYCGLYGLKLGYTLLFSAGIAIRMILQGELPVSFPNILDRRSAW